MNQTTRQRITGTLVLAVTALVLLPVIFDGEGSYQPTVEPQIPPRPLQPQAALQDAQRPEITANTDAIRIRPETDAAPAADLSPGPTTAAVDTSAQATGSAAAARPVAANPASSNPVSANPSPASPAANPVPANPVAANPVTANPAPAVSQPAAAVTTAAPAASAAVLDVNGLPEGWSVRLGSFSNTDNANNLLSRLQTAGHRAYTRRVESSQGMLTAVFVGPLVDRSAAQSLLERLRQEFELSGMIVRYEIEEL